LASRALKFVDEDGTSFLDLLVKRDRHPPPAVRTEADSADKFADCGQIFADTLQTLRTKLQTPCGHLADSVRTADTFLCVAERYLVSKRYGTYVCNTFESCMIKYIY
jgi:hypothetical protein